MDKNSYQGTYRGEHHRIWIDEWEDCQIGDYWWFIDKDGDRRHLVTVLLDPNNGPELLMWEVEKGSKIPESSKVWGWDGNKEKPTLQPSLNWINYWHGYMTDGRLQSV